MKKKNPLKLVIGVVCIVVLLLVTILAVILDSRSPDPILGIFRTEPTEETLETTEAPDPSFAATDATTLPQEETNPEQTNPQETDPEQTTENKKPENTEKTEDEQLAPPEELPPSVTIPSQKDPETGEDLGIAFPCQIPGYDLVIEKMAPYAGMFVEDGSNGNVQDVAMLMVSNNGDFPVEYTQICVNYADQTLLFDISALLAGEKLVVQEKNGQSIPEGKADGASALVVQRADMQMSEGKVQVTDNGNNTLTIRNLTDETIPTVRVFYKYYMEDEDIFVGGIAFTVRVARLAAGASVTIQPAHYTSQTSRVVMVLTYDSEV